MQADEKQKVIREAQAYLNSQMYKAAKDVGYQHMVTSNPEYVCLASRVFRSLSCFIGKAYYFPVVIESIFKNSIYLFFIY